MTAPLVRLAPSAARRVVAVVVLSGLAVFLVWIAAAVPNAPAWRLAMLVMGLGVAASVWTMWRGTRVTVDLREEGLFLSDGTALAPMDAIAGVDRGMFALKPSNGFVLRLARSLGPAWVPGLYWRIGRRVGIGGITDAGQARAMADILAARLAERDGG